MEPAMPFDPQSPASDSTLPAPEKPQAPDPDAPPRSPLAALDWANSYREWLPYWQKSDPVPPLPEQPAEIETPGEALTERQEAFCRAYVECPVARRAAVAAGYSPENAGKQANRLLKHPAIIRRLHALREVRGKGFQVLRETIIDQAEAVFEAAMDKHDYYAAMQALTMKARLAGFADYLPGVRILRREARHYEEEFWARAHAAEQRIMAARLGEIAGAAPSGGIDRDAVQAARESAEISAESAELYANKVARRPYDEAERSARARRAKRSI
jgi:hypothetical protein